jgi:hypothetical protein
MNKVRAVLASCLLAAMAASDAHAEEGTVIWKNYECGYFILQMKGGYGLYEWAAGPYPNDSDVIEGDLKSAGEHKVNNKTADVPTSIYLDTFSVKRSAISARIPAKCKTKPGYVPFEGQ